MKSKHLVFRENDFVKNEKFKNERSSFIISFSLFTFIAVFTLIERMATDDKTYHFMSILINVFISLTLLFELCELKDHALYAMRYLAETDKATPKNKFKFILNFNGFANLITLFGALATFGFKSSIYTLDSAFMEVSQAMYGVKVLSSPAELAAIYETFLTVFVCVYSFICLTIFAIFAILSCIIFTNGREIFSVDFNHKDKSDACKVTLMSDVGATKTIDLATERMAFSNGSVIVKNEYGSSLYSEERLQKIIVKDKEFTFNKAAKEWQCSLSYD